MTFYPTVTLHQQQPPPNSEFSMYNSSLQGWLWCGGKAFLSLRGLKCCRSLGQAKTQVLSTKFCPKKGYTCNRLQKEALAESSSHWKQIWLTANSMAPAMTLVIQRPCKTVWCSTPKCSFHWLPPSHPQSWGQLRIPTMRSNGGNTPFPLYAFSPPDVC